MDIPLNVEIAESLRMRAQRLYAKGDRHVFRARAFDHAAQAVETLDESLADMYKRSWIAGIQKIEGIGNRIARTIEAELKRRGVTRK